MVRGLRARVAFQCPVARRLRTRAALEQDAVSGQESWAPRCCSMRCCSGRCYSRDRGPSAEPLKALPPAGHCAGRFGPRWPECWRGCSGSAERGLEQERSALVGAPVLRSPSCGEAPSLAQLPWTERPLTAPPLTGPRLAPLLLKEPRLAGRRRQTSEWATGRVAAHHRAGRRSLQGRMRRVPGRRPGRPAASRHLAAMSSEPSGSAAAERRASLETRRRSLQLMSTRGLRRAPGVPGGSFLHGRRPRRRAPPVA
jgi:hypothetical protein